VAKPAAKKAAAKPAAKKAAAKPVAKKAAAKPVAKKAAAKPVAKKAAAKPVAKKAAAVAKAAVFNTCQCTGAKVKGGTCASSHTSVDEQWCYVATATSCTKTTEECDDNSGECTWYSEMPCAASATATVVATAKHAAVVKVPADGGAATGCMCVGGAAVKGNTCIQTDGESEKWCYVPGPLACKATTKECEGGACKWWSVIPCGHEPEAAAVAATAALKANPSLLKKAIEPGKPPVPASCACLGDSGVGNKCHRAKAGETPWCNIKTKAACGVYSVQHCEEGECNYYSEAPCKVGTWPTIPIVKAAPIVPIVKPIVKPAATPAVVKKAAPVVKKAAPAGCPCVGGTGEGDTCFAKDAASEKWCYVSPTSTCVKTKECEEGVCKHWSVVPCGGTPEKKAAPVATTASGCVCRGGTGEGNTCTAKDDESEKWCYVPGPLSCAATTKECEDGACLFWSVMACGGTPDPKALARTTALRANPAALAAHLQGHAKGAKAPPGCVCKGGTGKADTCHAEKAGEKKWCNVAHKTICGAHTVQECEEGSCSWWAEAPCWGTTGAPAAAKTVVPATAASCKCLGGTEKGMSCAAEKAGEKRWCYVAKGACGATTVEECENGECEWWSLTPCGGTGGQSALTIQQKADSLLKRARAHVAPRAKCQCKGGPLKGHSCTSGDKDNFGMSWCYIKPGHGCTDSKQDQGHRFAWSEQACAQDRAFAPSLPQTAPIKRVPPTKSAPASMGGTCRCVGGAGAGDSCSTTGLLKWCYIAAKSSCVDSKKGIGGERYWSEMACAKGANTIPGGIVSGKLTVQLQTPTAAAAAPAAVQVVTVERHSQAACTCKRGNSPGHSGSGSCSLPQNPWCYVRSAFSCQDTIKECANGKCLYWSTKACNIDSVSSYSTRNELLKLEKRLAKQIATKSQQSLMAAIQAVQAKVDALMANRALTAQRAPAAAKAVVAVQPFLFHMTPLLARIKDVTSGTPQQAAAATAQVNAAFRNLKQNKIRNFRQLSKAMSSKVSPRRAEEESTTTTTRTALGEDADANLENLKHAVAAFGEGKIATFGDWAKALKAH